MNRQHPARRRHVIRMIAGLAAMMIAVTGLQPAPAAAAPVNPPVTINGLLSATTLHNLVAAAFPTAETPAAPGGATVLVFGDSVTAGAGYDLFTDSRGCMHSATGWPQMLKKALGLADNQLLDASCWGGALTEGTGNSFADQVRYAERLGGVGPNTREIFIQLGHNDYWSSTGRDMLRTLISCFAGSSCTPVEGGAVTDPNDVTAGEYITRITPVIDYLRYYAPGARIHLVGYPAFTTPAAPGACMRVAGLEWNKPEAFVVPDFYTRLQKAQAETADQLGLGFIDVQAATAGHTSCSDQPWIAGIAAPKGARTVVWHPTADGNKAITDRVVAATRTHPATPSPAPAG